MRATGSFTDGRIHVTLLDGAFDLAAMDAADYGVYEQLQALYRGGVSLESLESLVDPTRGGFAVATRLRHRELLLSLHVDFCRRVALEESGQAFLLDRLQPWRPEESRELYEAHVGWRPVLEREQRLAA